MILELYEIEAELLVPLHSGLELAVNQYYVT